MNCKSTGQSSPRAVVPPAVLSISKRLTPLSPPPVVVVVVVVGAGGFSSEQKDRVLGADFPNGRVGTGDEDGEAEGEGDEDEEDEENAGAVEDVVNKVGKSSREPPDFLGTRALNSPTVQKRIEESGCSELLPGGGSGTRMESAECEGGAGADGGGDLARW